MLKIRDTLLVAAACVTALSANASSESIKGSKVDPQIMIEKIEKHRKRIKLDKKSRVEANLRKKSIVRKVGLPTGDWFYKGKIERAEKGERPPVVKAISNTVNMKKLTTEEFSLIEGADVENDHMAIGGGESGDVYQVEFDKQEIQELTDILEMFELSKGAAAKNDNEIEEDTFLLKAWSKGKDNRKPKGIFEHGSGGGFARIGQLDDYCTGTLIGVSSTDYYFITAAHCLFARKTGKWLDPDLIPRRDSCQTNKGASMGSSCKKQRYGSWNGGQYMTYQYFLDNCRGLSSLPNACLGRDIAVVRVYRPSGKAFPGAHGFGHYSQNFVKNRSTYNRGYPNCAGKGDPDADGGSANSSNDCRRNTLYGSGGKVNKFTSGGRIISNSFDTSGGMSGSPLYLYSSGAKVFGVQSSGNKNCFKGCTKSYPNFGARITSTFYGWMLNFMGI